MIKIIKHRVNKVEDIDSRFGIECDVWYSDYDYYVGHDEPSDIRFEEIIWETKNIIAINAKSCSLLRLRKIQPDSYFIFDAAVPEAIKLAKLGLNVYTRQSEYEEFPSFYQLSKGVWMDMMERDWVNAGEIQNHLDNNKGVAITSPELHGRDYKEFWAKLKEMDIKDDIYLCTKHPEEAQEFFNEKVLSK